MTYVFSKEHRSPNFYPASTVKSHYGRPRIITGITIHWWGDPANKPTFDGTVAYLCRANGNTSAHEIIEAGRVDQIVDPKDAAWHAGSAIGNATTIGLECNPRCSDEDYATIAERIRDLRVTYGPLPLYPHSHWYATACPGNYDLARLDRMALSAESVAVVTNASTSGEESTMQVIQGAESPDVYITNGIVRRWLPEQILVDEWCKMLKVEKQTVIAQYMMDRIPIYVQDVVDVKALAAAVAAALPEFSAGSKAPTADELADKLAQRLAS